MKATLARRRRLPQWPTNRTLNVAPDLRAGYIDQPTISVAAASGVDVSPQAIEQRYSSSLVAFFKVLFGKMAKQIVASEVTLAPIPSRFTDVILIDSSVVVLPDSEQSEFRGCGGSYQANQSAIKLQTEFSLFM